MGKYKLIVHNNEFVVVEIVSEFSSFKPKHYNIANSKEEIFQMWEEARIKRKWNEFEIKSEIAYVYFIKGYKSNPYKYDGEELLNFGRYLMNTKIEGRGISVLFQDYILETKMQRIKECFVEVETEEVFTKTIEYKEIKLHPNNSVRVTKIIV